MEMSLPYLQDLLPKHLLSGVECKRSIGQSNLPHVQGPDLLHTGVSVMTAGDAEPLIGFSYLAAACSCCVTAVNLLTAGGADQSYDLRGRI